MPANRREWLREITPDDVTDVLSFADYCQQTIGVPYPTIKDMNIVRKKVNEFFAEKPFATWQTLCRVAHWAKAKKRRPTSTWQLVTWWKYAWRDGFLPELDPGRETDPELEDKIEQAIAAETDSGWRERLRDAQGVLKRRETYRQWFQERS